MMSWTDDRVEQLKKLWTDGFSASQIAAQLGGVTRNAVIGKVHRLGLSGRVKPQATTIARVKRSPDTYQRSSGGARVVRHGGSSGNTALKIDTSMFLAPDAEAMPAQVIAFAPESKRITLMELTEKSCRFPLGDPTSSEFRYCGCDSNGSLPYCSYHVSIAYQSTGERKRRHATAH